MSRTITPAFVFGSICAQLAGRSDLWHVVNGPKRETWFTAETIAALSRSSSNALNQGLRVYGEESYAEMALILQEHQIPHLNPVPNEDKHRIPDVSILEAPSVTAASFTIAEAKLISPKSTKDDDAMEMTSDLDDQLKALGTTAKADGLLDQLNRARRIVPNAQVIGLIFAVHRLSQCEDVSADAFFARLAGRMPTVFNGTDWQLWADGIAPVPNLQHVKPLSGMFCGEASLGLGIVIAVRNKHKAPE